MSIELSYDMYVVLALLGAAIFLFITDLLRVDLVGLLMMVLLPLLGVLPAEEAIAGLSSNAVVSIIAVMILGAGLNRTGVMNIAAQYIIKIAGKSENRIMIVIASAVAVISSFMQNIGAAALFMPTALRICHQLNIPAGRIFMPMGFCAIIGGCLTLVGSSPLIMLNDLMAGWWQNAATDDPSIGEFIPYTLLAVTPIGISLLFGGILYFVVLGRFILPKSICDTEVCGMDKRLQNIYGEEVGHGYELQVQKDFRPATLGELHIRPKYHITVVGVVKKSGKKILSPNKDTQLDGGDHLWVMSSENHIAALAKDQGWRVKRDFDIFAADAAPDESGVMEGVVIHHSHLTTHTMEELNFRGLFRVNPLAIVRGEEILMEEINVTKLQQGDTILMQGAWKQFRLLAEKTDLALLGSIPGEKQEPEKAQIAVFWLIAAITLALGFKVKLSIALLTGALGMILSKVIRADHAYSSVDWRTVFLLAGLIPLGTAFETTGTAAWIAEGVLAMVGTLPPLGLLLIIALLTSFFSLAASNVGAVVLMIPLAMNMAVNVGVNPQVAALTVAIAASNTFILPTHQVNALIMRPGNYCIRDFIKAGAGMSILYLVILLGCLWIFYGI